jgi:hypothetical protein
MHGHDPKGGYSPYPVYDLLGVAKPHHCAMEQTCYSLYVVIHITLLAYFAFFILS